MLRMLWDERRISFRTEDEEQLWRLFYRRSGMQRLEFKQASGCLFGRFAELSSAWCTLPAAPTPLLPHGSRLWPTANHMCLPAALPCAPQVLRFGRWERVRAGQLILTGGEAHLRFCVLVEGLVSLQEAYQGQLSEPRLQVRAAAAAAAGMQQLR